MHNSATCGIVSSKARQSSELHIGSRTEYIQTDAIIHQGNSGGPLINLDGEVIGINAMKAAVGDGVGFAIPMDIANPILQQLRSNRKVERPYVGIKLLPLSVAEVKRQKGIGTLSDDCRGGVMVAAVAPNSPAQSANLREGDIIVAIDDAEVTKNADVFKALGIKVNTPVRVTVIRTKPYREKLVVTVTPTRLDKK